MNSSRVGGNWVPCGTPAQRELQGAQGGRKREGANRSTREAGLQAAARTGQAAGGEEQPHSSFLSVGPSTAAWKGQKPQGKGSTGCTPHLQPLAPPP